MNQPQLPAYLQSRQSRIVSEGAADGIGGSLPPHISIRGNEFTLIDAAGNKQEVDEKYLDVCFVDRSDVVCKQYYEQDWTDGSNDPPTCFSANGIAPSIEASQPQSATCAACQWNVRGSDVSKISGKAIKACRDEKWTAVILPKYPAMIFQFRVTPGSFVAWKGYVDKFKGQATDLSDVVTRLAFEKGKNGVLTFEAVSYIDRDLYVARESAAVERKTDVLVGRLDRPIQAALASPRQEAGQAPLPISTAGAQTVNPSFGHQEQLSATPIQKSTPTPLTAGFVPTAFPSDPAAAGQAQGRRKRRTKAEIEAANALTAAGHPHGAGLAPNDPRPPQGSQFGGGNAGPAPFRPAAPPAAASPAPAGLPGGGQGFGMTHAVAPDPAMTAMLSGIFGPANPAK